MLRHLTVNPTQKKKIYIDDLETYLDTFQKECPEIYVVDINNNLKETNYNDTLISNGFISYINKPI